jgi:hypothetical protein
MATEFNLNSASEFQEMIDNKDFRICQAIVETILSNLNTRKKHIHVLSVNFLNEGNTYDLTLEKRHFADTLEDNLKYYVEQEKYEDCSRIVKAIDTLRKKAQKTLTPKKQTTPHGQSQDLISGSI